LGHIDHGKTTLLDYIRKTNIAQKESGGITQHIGAYQIEKEGKKITFIDTPGHEAFLAMRSRGAKVADIAILVIDATEGVKAQTKEAISHIKEAKIPFIVALNKIDRPEADPEKVKRELQKEDILVEDLGGKIPSVLVSAKTGEGVDDLIDLIFLLAEMESLKADISKSPEGVIIEAFLDSKRGPLATLILKEGILKTGDIIATPSTIGKVKRMEDFQGKVILKAEPAQPVLILGLGEVPRVGEKLKVFENLEAAQEYTKERKKEKISFEITEILPEKKTLNLILKTDVIGTAEGIIEVLRKLPQEKVALKILKAEVGNINISDLKLAKETKATILAFRVNIDLAAKVSMEREPVRIIRADIIYEIVEAVRKLMEKAIEAKIVRTDLGKVKVLIIFMTKKNRQIIGGKIIEGEVEKGAKIEVQREEEVVGRGKIINLQRNKKDVPRLSKGQDCGILYEGNVKIQEGDILVIYKEERKKEEL